MTMNGRTAIYAIMLKEGIGTAELARRVGKTATNVDGQLSNKFLHDMPADILSLMLRKMGYCLVVMPINYKAGDTMIFIDHENGKNDDGFLYAFGSGAKRMENRYKYRGKGVLKDGSRVQKANKKND